MIVVKWAYVIRIPHGLSGLPSIDFWTFVSITWAIFWIKLMASIGVTSDDSFPGESHIA